MWRTTCLAWCGSSSSTITWSSLHPILAHVGMRLAVETRWLRSLKVIWKRVSACAGMHASCQCLCPVPQTVVEMLSNTARPRVPGPCTGRRSVEHLVCARLHTRCARVGH